MSSYIIRIILFKKEVETCKEAIFKRLIFILMAPFLLLKEGNYWGK